MMTEIASRPVVNVHRSLELPLKRAVTQPKPEEISMPIYRYRLALLLLILTLFTGCASGGGYDGGWGLSESKGLGIVGYNYTDKYIDSFLVNGGGGGNVSAHQGGGGIVCCIAFNPRSKLPFPVTIRWTDSFHKEARYSQAWNEHWEEIVRDWKETTVMFNGPVPKDPKYFEVYFYPNGEVRVGITTETSNYYDHAPAGEKR